MNKIESFINILTGEFDNSEQFEDMKKKGIDKFPFAKHISTVCNSKIKNIPEGFNGVFVLEESYYTIDGKTNSSPHLFLFVEDGRNVVLSSYDMPEGYDKNTFTYENIDELEFSSLKKSSKFTPANYALKEGVWEGGSESMFTPVLKFKLDEKFSEDKLEVSETMEVNGKKTFGFEEPIIYKRVIK